MKNFKFVLASLFCFVLSVSPMFVKAQGCTSCSGTSPECYRVIHDKGVTIFHGEKKACPEQ